ncbi:MAG: sce7726 family protein [Nibricoccus sp.]
MEPNLKPRTSALDATGPNSVGRLLGQGLPADLPRLDFAELNFKAIPKLAGFLRSPFVRRAIQNRHKTALRTVVRELGLSPQQYLKRPLTAVLSDFHVLLQKYRKCEYIYKNAIANALFLERHYRDSSYLSAEFRCGGSRVDIAIFNGTSTAYEIKTELDTFTKLPKQIADYRNVFDRVYVVLSDRFKKSDLSVLDQSIGIIVVDYKLRIKVIRRAKSNINHVSPSAIFDCLRRDEYLTILKRHRGFKAECANSEIRRRAKNEFCSLTPEEAHTEFVACMRARKNPSLLKIIGDVPKSLRYLSLTLESRPNSIATVTKFLHLPAV